jgi:hypothetical protein
MLRNFDRRKAPRGFTASDLSRLFAQFEPRFRSDGAEWAARDNDDPRWRLLMVAGMWFQDLFNFDLSVVRMDAARVAVAQQGEISFCAYNSAGWRSVIEHFHKTATLAVWHDAHGRHPIYANGATVPLGRDGRPAPTGRTDLSELVVLSKAASTRLSGITGEAGSLSE